MRRCARISWLVLRRSSLADRWDRTIGRDGGIRLDAPFATHGLHCLAQGGEQEIASFFEREKLCWVMPSALATRACGRLRALRESRKLISSAISSAAQASTFFRRATGSLAVLSRTFTGMATFSTFSGGREGHRNDSREKTSGSAPFLRQGRQTTTRVIRVLMRAWLRSSAVFATRASDEGC
jgi:hypothetical protein